DLGGLEASLSGLRTGAADKHHAVVEDRRGALREEQGIADARPPDELPGRLVERIYQSVGRHPVDTAFADGNATVREAVRGDARFSADLSVLQRARVELP